MPTLKEIAAELGRLRPGNALNYSRYNLPVKHLTGPMSKDIAYRPNENTLYLYALAPSQSQPGEYAMMVQFEGVEHVLDADKTDIRFDIPVQVGDELYYIAPVNYANHSCKLFCGCQDYRFNFDYQNVTKNSSTTAQFMKYNRKTPPPSRPPHPQNPNNLTYVDPVTGALRKAYDFKNPSNWQGYCFTGDTKVYAKKKLDSVWRVYQIKDLTEVDSFEVMSFDIKKQKSVVGNAHSCSLKEKNASLIKLEIEGERDIRCTPDHLFLTTYGWIDAKNLNPGDNLISVSTALKHLKPTRVVSGVMTLEEKEDVYCMTVDKYENFALAPSGIIVHNCKHLHSFIKVLIRNKMVRTF